MFFIKKYVIWIAWKNIVSRNKKYSLSFMTWVSVFAVAIGVFALVLVLSIMAGFSDDIKEKIFKGQSHIEIWSNHRFSGFSIKEISLDKIKKENNLISHIEPFVQNDIVISNNKNIATCILFGIDPKKMAKVWGFNEATISKKIKNLSQNIDQNKISPIILGEELAFNIDADIGDIISIINPQNQGYSFFNTNQIKSKNFKVIDKFYTGLSHYDSKFALVNIDQARIFMIDFDESILEEKYVSGVAIKTKNPYRVDDIVENLNLDNKKFKIDTWKTLNKSKLFALKLEKFTMSAILMLIIVVASFSISGTVMMNVFHKKNQINTLIALGVSRLNIFKVFMVYGFIIGVIGLFIGLFLAIFVCFLIKYQFLNIYIPNVYVLHYLKVKILPLDYLIISAISLILVILACFYPSTIASKQKFLV